MLIRRQRIGLNVGDGSSKLALPRLLFSQVQAKHSRICLAALGWELSSDAQSI
jgi:hypothetical protein